MFVLCRCLFFCVVMLLCFGFLIVLHQLLRFHHSKNTHNTNKQSLFVVFSIVFMEIRQKQKAHSFCLLLFYFFGFCLFYFLGNSGSQPGTESVQPPIQESAILNWTSIKKTNNTLCSFVFLTFVVRSLVFDHSTNKTTPMVFLWVLFCCWKSIKHTNTTTTTRQKSETNTATKIHYNKTKLTTCNTQKQKHKSQRSQQTKTTIKKS